MDYRLAAVGGVLLAVSSDVTPDQLTATENSLLLGWLAARKKEGTAPVQLSDLTSVMSTLGWVAASESSTTTTVPFATLSQSLWSEGLSNTDAAPFLASCLTDAVHKKVVAAWWSHAWTGPAANLVAAAVTGGASAHLALDSVSVADLGWFELLCSTPEKVAAPIRLTAWSLNSGVYASVAPDVASKLAPFANQIVSQ